MSAYGHQMDREYSVQSLSSRGGSDMGSQYIVESGIYMSSFAAAVFVAALIIAAVLLMTLLVSLTVMLQSCQSQSAGVVEISKPSYDYNYCKILAMHAELNNLDSNSLPAYCEKVVVQYIKDGQYMRDLNISASMVDDFFGGVRPVGGGLDVVLMDVDDFFPSDSPHIDMLLPRFGHHVCDNCIEDAEHLKGVFFRQLYMKLQVSGWSMILFSRKPAKLRNATEMHLVSAGCGGWFSLLMRLDDEMKINSHEYFSRRRAVLQEEGFTIMAVISSHMDALTGPCLGKRVFKLPNPIYYNAQYT